MKNDFIDVMVWKFGDYSFSSGEDFSTLDWMDNRREKPTMQELEQADAEYSIYIEKKNINDPILKQIIDLETEITPRRQREALVTQDYSFVQNIDSLISNLRTQLV